MQSTINYLSEPIKIAYVSSPCDNCNRSIHPGELVEIYIVEGESHFYCDQCVIKRHGRQVINLIEYPRIRRNYENKAQQGPEVTGE
jgi:hypothetical protein